MIHDTYELQTLSVVIGNTDDNPIKCVKNHQLKITPTFPTPLSDTYRCFKKSDFKTVSKILKMLIKKFFKNALVTNYLIKSLENNVF